MKDPADRYQSCEELIASIQGQPIAATGAVRASAAAVARRGRAGSATGRRARWRRSPPIVSQPTTPLDSPLVNRRMTPRERREVPRRVADRSVAMRGSSSSWAWLWIAGGAGRRWAAPSTTTRPTDSRPASAPSRRIRRRLRGDTTPAHRYHGRSHAGAPRRHRRLAQRLGSAAVAGSPAAGKPPRRPSRSRLRAVGARPTSYRWTAAASASSGCRADLRS